MTDKRKKAAVKRFRKEAELREREVTENSKKQGHLQDNTFSEENSFVSQKPPDNLPGAADSGRVGQGQGTSGHSVRRPGIKYQDTSGHDDQKPETEYQDTSGHDNQKPEAEAEREFLRENSFINENPEDGPEKNCFTGDDTGSRDTYRKSEKKSRYHKRRVHLEQRKRATDGAVRREHGTYETKNSTFIPDGSFPDQKAKASGRTDKADKKPGKARERLPKKTEYAMERVFDEKTGKTKYVVREVEEKKLFPAAGAVKRTAQSLENESIDFVHGKIAEHENENAAVEAAHKTEQRAEEVFRYAGYRRRGKKQRQRERAARLEKKKEKAGIEFEYQKFIREHPQMDEKGRHKKMQK